MNELETQLRMWAPRRPSAALKERLFAHPSTQPATAKPDTGSSAPPSFRLSWLAPATVCLVAMCALFAQRNPVINGSGDSAPMVAVILSNHSASAYLPGSYDSTLAGRNRLPADTFEWTNRSGSTSSIRSLAGSSGKN